MRRTLLGAVALAALLAPSLATAKVAPMNPDRPGADIPLPQRQYQNQFDATDSAALGNGINGRSNGDVAGPGDHVRIDNSSKGPMDDRDPGNPYSEDVPRSANPRPLR